MKDLDSLDPTTVNLRLALRAETRAAHDLLDHRMSALNLRSRDGFGVFCHCHALAFEILASRCDDAALKKELWNYVARLDQDLATLGQARDDDTSADTLTYDDLAVAYIVNGSRLGTKVLRKTWALSEDLSVQSASAYMSGDVDALAWQKTCASLEAVDASAQRGRQIVIETLDIFALFQRSLDHAKLCRAERSQNASNGHVNDT